MQVEQKAELALEYVPEGHAAQTTSVEAVQGAAMYVPGLHWDAPGHLPVDRADRAEPFTK